MIKNPQQPIIKRLILHFNIDKTIVMRDSMEYNNPDYHIRDLFSELMWGKIELNKNNETIFKIGYNELVFDKTQVPDQEMINYKQFLDEKYKLKSEEEDPNEELRTIYNTDVTAKKVKLVCDLVETGNPGVKFKKLFEDMKKKLRVDDKMHVDYSLKIEKLDEKLLPIKEEVKFSDLEEDKKIKREYSLILRFFGHEDEEIEEFMYEFNHFCECAHPRYSGDYGFSKARMDGTAPKEPKDFRIRSEKSDNIAVCYRNISEQSEAFAFETTDRPEKSDMEDIRESIEDFYENSPVPTKICKGYNNIFLNIMDKLAQYPTFVILDDYSFYQKNGNKHGKLMLIDPFDYDTLQIFFDTDLHKFPEKIDVVDIVNKKNLEYSYCINKFIVNVDQRKAILDINYFLNKIEECEANRAKEILNIGLKEFPLQPVHFGFDMEREIRKISSDRYLEMTIFPLLNTAMNIVDQIRPSDPIAFIANFMLKNKNTMKRLDEFIKETPPSKNTTEIKYDGMNDMMDLDNSESNEI